MAKVGTVRDQGDPNDVVAIDPGVRRFATTYSPEGDTVIYGTNTNRVVDKLIRRIDRRTRAYGAAKSNLELQKQCDHVQRHHGRLFRRGDRQRKSRLRTRLWRARRRFHAAYKKARDVVRNFHYNVAHDLLQRNNTIICPTTGSHSWRTRRLPSLVKRRSQMLSFGKFAHRLVQTSTWYSGKRILRGSEAYTSKQCGACGHINDTLGSSLEFTCTECNLVADRDIHAARNILLRFLA